MTLPLRTPLLRIESLNIEVGRRRVVQDLSLEVDAGEALGLAGESGSGKTMTALAILRLLPPEARVSGRFELAGTDLQSLSEAAMRRVRGAQIGMVFQEPMMALNPLMRIGAQVAETVRLHRPATRAQADREARAALDSVGLGGAASFAKRSDELSGGQRQRVAIAIAIVLRPALLIADEPTTALDVITQAQVLELLADLKRERRMALILVSHDLAVLARYTDRIALMQDGRIVDGGALGELRLPYARALIAAANPAPKAAVSPASKTDPVLEVRGIVRDYARERRSLWRAPAPFRALDDVSLTLDSGETVGLVGESGSGKSSLLRTILALDPPQHGEVLLLGESLSAARGARLKRLRRSIQAVFQDPYGSFDPLWSVERVVAEPFHLFDVTPSPAERRDKVAAMLARVGLAPGDAARRPHEFSGGQRQRIAIARALITEPRVIAFDEAVSALDVLVRAQLLELLLGLAQRLGLAYLFISHDLNVVRAVADRVYVMQQGRIVEHGPAAQVLESPQHPYTQALVAATPWTRA